MPSVKNLKCHTTPTHFKCFVENAEAPRTLPATSDNLHAELVFCVGSEVIDMNIQLRCVYHLLPTAGRAAAGAARKLVPTHTHVSELQLGN